MPSIYLGHGAPPLLDDPVWMSELAGWAADMPRPRQILIVSAHWQTAPMALCATRTVPLVYDFFGFPQRYYELTYAAPGAPERPSCPTAFAFGFRPEPRGWAPPVTGSARATIDQDLPMPRSRGLPLL